MMRLADRDNRALGEALWRFSLALYTRPGVADALVAIQDRAGRDVNVILYGLWLGVTRDRRLGAADVAAAEAAIAPVHDAAVAPLRRLRRQLKPASDPVLQALRRRIAALEIAAERQALYRLAACFGGPARASPEGGWITAADANLTLILGDESGSPEAGVVRRAVAALARRAG
jgi:uncharacterized protein (TIGR02444 family)